MEPFSLPSFSKFRLCLTTLMVCLHAKLLSPLRYKKLFTFCRQSLTLYARTCWPWMENIATKSRSMIDVWSSGLALASERMLTEVSAAQRLVLFLVQSRSASFVAWIVPCSILLRVGHLCTLTFCLHMRLCYLVLVSLA